MALPLDLILPVLGALIAGGAIGFEREYHSRPAGLRTHMLVCLASASLMIAATHQLEWMPTEYMAEVIRIDPTRMAHGILTGVGFLCGGVIFQQRMSVFGLTTAASLWVTAALGILFGVEFYPLAIGGTVLVVAVLAPFRWLNRNMPQLNLAEITVRTRRDAPVWKADLIALAKAHGLQGAGFRMALRDNGQIIEIGARFSGRNELKTDTFAQALAADPRIIEFDIAPRQD